MGGDGGHERRTTARMGEGKFGHSKKAHSGGGKNDGRLVKRKKKSHRVDRVRLPLVIIHYGIFWMYSGETLPYWASPPLILLLLITTTITRVVVVAKRRTTMVAWPAGDEYSIPFNHFYRIFDILRNNMLNANNNVTTTTDNSNAWEYWYGACYWVKRRLPAISPR